MKIKNYIIQGLFPLFAAGMFIAPLLSSCEEDDAPTNTAPTLTVQEVANALRTSATLTGTISGETSLLKEYGFDYSTSQDFPSDRTTRVPMTDSGNPSSLSVQVKDLTPNERYYYRLYASTGASTVYSDTQDFRTANMSAPQISDLTVDSIGEQYARFIFQVEDYGNEVLIECGVSYKKSDSKTFIPIASEEITTDDRYVIEITDLEADTQYDFRPYAKNAQDKDATTGSIEGYGNILTQKTEAMLSASVETGAIDEGDISITSVKVAGTILSAVGSNGAIDECGFVYSRTNPLPTYNSDNRLVHQEEDINVSRDEYTYTEEITDLLQNTLYYVRAYAKSTVDGKERISYGTAYEFTTKQLNTPVLEFIYKGDNSLDYTRTATSLTVKATITNYDANALIEKGVIWSRSIGELSLEDAKTAGTYQAVTTGENAIVATIKDLEMDCTYYIRAYAVYKSGDLTEIGYAQSVVLRTDGFNLPSLEAEANTQKLTYNSIELIGKIPNPGNANITERGFVLSSKNSEVTLENCEKSVKAEKDFIVTMTGLKYQTEYYVRAYAKCTLGGRTETAYSGWISFRSQDCPGVEFSYGECSATATTLNIKATISNYNANTLVEKGVIWSKTQSDLSLADAKKANTYKAVTGGESQIAATIEGLELGNSYYVRAYIVYKSGDATETGYSGYNQFRTDGFNLPNLGVDVTNEKMTYNSAELVGKIENSGNGKITERGFVLSPKLSEVTLENCDKAIKADESFVATATGLAYQTNYYVRAYVKCELGGKAETVYSGWNNFQTRDIDRPKFEAFESSATLSSLNLTVTIEPGKQGTIVKRGFCAVLNENNAPEPTIDGLKTEEAVTAASGKTYKAELKGLLFGTGYRVRAYAVVQLENGEQLVCYSNEIYWVNTRGLSINMQFTPTDTQCTVQATIESDVDLSNAEYGFVWTEENTWEPEKATDRLKCTNMDVERKFSGVIKNLTGGKRYYLWVYTTINGRTIYSGGSNFTTKRAPGQDDNVSPDQKQ